MTIIEFFCAGVPKPGGSKRPFLIRRKGGQIATRANGSPMIAVVDASGQAGKDWRAVVAHEAMIAYQREPLEGPIRLTVTFVMPRPKSHRRRQRSICNENLVYEVLKKDAPKHHTCEPDATKLLRCCEDALTGLVWRDDAQIVEQHVSKVYGERPGASVKVERISDA